MVFTLRSLSSLLLILVSLYSVNKIRERETKVLLCPCLHYKVTVKLDFSL